MSQHRPLHQLLRRFSAAAAISAVAWSGTAWAAPGVMTVEVFANSAMHITPSSDQQLPYQLKVYRLDGLQQLEASLSQQLPQNEAQARAWLANNQARMQRQVTPQAVQAANGIVLAHHYKIKRLPAVVIDRKVIVYGMTDVSAAIERARSAPPVQRRTP